jgi:tRNA(Ile)-lysidine synthase
MSRKKPSGKRARAGGLGLPQRVLHSLQHQEMVRAGERVGVAVSGGADSVALLLLLLELREKIGMVLSVVHFNHMLRGRASQADEKFVEKLAAKHGLAFRVERADVAATAKRQSANLEDTARRLRYEFFSRLVEKGQVTRVAVAHTADDQAETVLGHILRGTGLAGLGGIHPVVGPVIRPLLDVRRAELRGYLRAKKQTWREDVTNLDTTRMRARIRMKLLPLLEKQFQPAIVEHLCTLAELAREDEAFFEEAVEERMAALVQKTGGGTRIGINDLVGPCKKKEASAAAAESAGQEQIARALSKRMVRRIVGSIKPRSGQLGARHVDAVLGLTRGGQSGNSLSLPGGVEVCRERDALVFRGVAQARDRIARPALREYEYNIDVARGSQELQVPELGCVFRFTVIDWPSKRGETNRDGAVLDCDRLRSPLVLRNWRPGDRMRPMGHRSAHKLKRLLNEKRISRWERDGWPVLASGGVLVWARGFHAAAEFAAGERTRAGIVIAEEQL